MNENESNNPPVPKLDTETQKKLLERMINSAPNEEIKEIMQKQLAELNKKNN
jgi:hypothetical protein